MKYISLFESFSIDENTSLYNDNPREFVKTLKDYKTLILTIIGKQPIEISKIIENWIIKNENILADSICGVDSEYINCEHAAEIASQILSDAKLTHTLQVGIINNQSHAWVKLNNIIIDPTKDQFPNIKNEDYKQEIYWEKTYNF